MDTNKPTLDSIFNTTPQGSSRPSLDSIMSGKYKAPAPTAPKLSAYDTAMGKNNTKPSIASDVINSMNEHGKNIMNDIAASDPKHPVLSALANVGHASGNIAGTVGDMFGSVLSHVIPQPIKNASAHAVQFVGNEINKIPGMTDKLKSVNDFMDKNPDVAKSISDVFNAVSLLGGEKAEIPVKDSIVTGANTLKDAAGNIIDKAKAAVTKTPEEIATQTAKAQADLESKAIQDATPSYNKKLISDRPIKNADGTTSPRVTEAKGISERKVNSTPSEIEAGKELAKIEGYDPKATALDKYNKVSDYNLKQAKNLESSLKNEKVAIPRKELNSIVKKAVNGASENSLLLQKTDPIVKNYIRVTQRAITKADGTLGGELSVRKALDQAYKDAGGEYANNKGLDQIHRAARNALNDDMESRAQSTQVKASLKQQSNLYKAADTLLEKARAEGGTKWEQFKKAHPVLTKTARPVGRWLGIGAGVHMIP